MPATAPTFNDRQTSATFHLFEELECIRNEWDGDNDDLDEDDEEDEDGFKINDVVRLDVEKMMTRVLDGLAAVCEAQRVRVALKKPLKLKEGGDALTSEQQAARNRVFLAALNTVAKGLTHDGAPERADPGFSTELLLRAFPDDSKLTDGRGWLPMHWALVAGEDKEFDVTEADVMRVYETDPMELRQHHLVAVTDDEADRDEIQYGYTPAHLLCGMEMTEKNMSLVRYLSVSDPRAFTMKAVTYSGYTHSFSALHVACLSPHRTEALLRLLVQLDPSQMKAITWFGGPLGLLCKHSEKLDERQFRCLVEADISVEVVHDAICRYIENKSTLVNRVQAVAKLLEANPAAAQHKGEKDNYIAHEACVFKDAMTATECIEVLKLILASHKDALKMVDEYGNLPAHFITMWGPAEVLDFVLGEYPGAAAVVDDESRNLLHLATGWNEDRMAKVRLLCALYPDMMLQRDSGGYTPLLRSCAEGPDAMSLLLIEAGGREVVSAAILHPSNAEYLFNGWLPLHFLIYVNAATLIEGPLSEAGDVFHLLLRLYPEAAGTEGGVGVFQKKTPYQLAVEDHLPAYYRRLLLRAAPDVDPAELCRLNWEERRLAMFVAYAAVAKSPSLLARLRAANKDLVKHVVSFL